LQIHSAIRTFMATGALATCLSLSAMAEGASPAQAAPAQQPANSAGTNEVVHILVGHSVVVRTESRIKRVLVGNAAAVTTATTAPNEVVMTAVAPGSSSVVLWQENKESRILEVFADLDVALLRDAIARGFPGEPIEVEAEESRIVLSGTASSKPVADQIVKMAAPFSKEVVDSLRIAQPGRLKQILLKVRFAQVDRSKLSQFGINLFSTGGANTFGATGTGQFAGATSTNVGSIPATSGTTGTVTGSSVVAGAIGNHLTGQPGGFGMNDLLNIFLFRSDINLGATIRALQQNNVLEILAEPNLLAASGEPARFLAGGELPYPVVSGAQGQSTVNVQFKPFGVKLEFTGTVEDNNTIRLKVFPEVSSLDFANAVTISGFVLPAIATRHAETVVELKDGQSFGIAGLLDQRATTQLSKVPGLGDIPILGQLFRSRSINKTNSELLVIVTPTIVDPLMASTPAEAPAMPVPMMDPKQFDKTVPGSNVAKDEKKQP
jgi:pilus assembly protein CpaC